MTRWGPSGGERSVRGGSGVDGSVGADAAAVPTIHATPSSPCVGVPADGGTRRDSRPRPRLHSVEAWTAMLHGTTRLRGSGFPPVAVAPRPAAARAALEAPTKGPTMSTIAIIGAGPGLGQATARR